MLNIVSIIIGAVSLLFALVAFLPLLGWMTYAWGPGAGIATFLLGLLVLIRAAASTGTRRRRRAALVAPPVRPD